MPKAIITGITGSGGSYLADYLTENQPEVEVHGIARWHSTSSHNNLVNCLNNVHLHECDLTDFSAVFNVLSEVKPDIIFHLASHANVRACWINPLAVIQNNIMTTANLLEGVRAAKLDPLVQLCSTSEVYGNVKKEDVPITEKCPINATNPYSVSKLCQDQLGWSYFNGYGMRIIRTRMFSYLNPRREDLFATSFARQIALIEVGKQKELLHGNLDSIRTLIDVRDAMHAYWMATTDCIPGEVYNIGGNVSMTVGEFLEELIKLANCPIPHHIDKSLLRPVDVTLQIPCVDKFIKQTGWRQQYTLQESIKFLLDYWRQRVNGIVAPTH